MKEWTPIDDECPLCGEHVLLGGYNKNGKWRSYHARWIPARTEELYGDWLDEDWADYDDKTNTCYAPEGWYEIHNVSCETDYQITEPITHYCKIPAPPANEEDKSE